MVKLNALKRALNEPTILKRKQKERQNETLEFVIRKVNRKNDQSRNKLWLKFLLRSFQLLASDHICEFFAEFNWAWFEQPKNFAHKNGEEKGRFEKTAKKTVRS